MTKHAALFIFLAFAFASFGQDIRYIGITNDLTSGIYQDQPVQWWQGESVTMDVTAKRGRVPVSLPESGVAVFRVWKTNAPSILYVNVTGTVLNAAAGVSRVSLTPTESNVAPSGNFYGEVGVWDTTNFFGVVMSGPVTINYSPAGSNLSYVGTSDLLAAVLTGATINSASPVTGSVTRVGNQLDFILYPSGYALSTTVAANSNALNSQIVGASNALALRIATVETGKASQVSVNATNAAFQSAIDAKVETSTYAASTNATAIQILANSNAANTRITALETGKYNLATAISTNAGIQAQIDTKLPTTTHASSTASIWSAIGAIVSADNAITNIIATGSTRLSVTKTNAQSWINFNAAGINTGDLYQINAGSGITVSQGSGPVAIISAGPSLVTTSALASTLAGYATTGALADAISGVPTGTPLYAFTESDPVWSASSNDYLTTNAAANTYATITALSSSGAAHNAAIAAINASGWSAYPPTQALNRAGASMFSVIGAGSAFVTNAGDGASSGGMEQYVFRTSQGLGAVAAMSNQSSFTKQMVFGGYSTGVVRQAFGAHQFVFAGKAEIVGGNGAIQILQGVASANHGEAYTSGDASIQLAYLSSGQYASNSGKASITLGAVTNATDHAIVAAGPITTLAGFFGDGAGLTGIQNILPIAVVNWNGQALTNISYIGDFDDAIDFTSKTLFGPGWGFENQPIIPGYLTTNGNANGLTNFPATLVTTAQLASSGLGATNLSLAIGAGATNSVNAMGAAVGLVATNFNLARGAQATNAQIVASNAAAGVVAVGAVATNAQTVANAAVPWLSFTGGVQSVTTTNLGTAVWSNTPAIRIGTNTPVNLGSRVPALTIPVDPSGVLSRSSMIQFFHLDSGGNPTNTSLQVDTNGTLRIYKRGQNGGVGGFTIPDSETFNAALYLTIASYNAALTNSLRVYDGVVTQNQIGVWNVGFQSTTNLWLPLAPGGTTNWIKYEGRLNVY